MRKAWMVAVAALLMAAASAAAVEDPHGIGYDGRDWKAMSEQARLAFVAGFLAGAATEQAVEQNRRHPKISVDAAVSEILQTHTGTFPYGTNVYKNDLDDYYFYTNNLSVRLYRALLNENATMRNQPVTK
jgi:hypothetical protein